MTEAQVLAVGPTALDAVWDIGQMNAISSLYLYLYNKKVKLDKRFSVFSMIDPFYYQRISQTATIVMYT